MQSTCKQLQVQDKIYQGAIAPVSSFKKVMIWAGNSTHNIQVFICLSTHIFTKTY
jgi:hypothetical protein